MALPTCIDWPCPRDGISNLASGVSPCSNRKRRARRAPQKRLALAWWWQTCGQELGPQTSRQTCEAKPVISSSGTRLLHSSSRCGSPWLCAASSRVCRPHALAALTRIQSRVAATAWTTHTRSSRPRTATWACRRWPISFHCSRVAGSTRPAAPMGGPRPQWLSSTPPPQLSAAPLSLTPQFSL